MLIFIHPQGVPDLAKRLAGSGGLGNVIGNPLETTIALSHLIFEGTLDRHAGLTILAAHGGGFLPSYAARSDAGIRTFPGTYTTPLRKPPTAYLKDLYFDSLVFTPEALRHLAAEVGPDRIMLGTDFPYPWTDRAVAHILETPASQTPTKPTCSATWPHNSWDCRPCMRTDMAPSPQGRERYSASSGRTAMTTPSAIRTSGTASLVNGSHQVGPVSGAISSRSPAPKFWTLLMRPSSSPAAVTARSPIRSAK